MALIVTGLTLIWRDDDPKRWPDKYTRNGLELHQFKLGEYPGDAGNRVFLCHRSDLTNEVEAALKRQSALNDLVVLYTAGRVAKDDDRAAAGGTLILHRSLSEAKDVIRRVDADWTVNDFQTGLDRGTAETRHHGFVTLSILCQCVTAPSPSVRVSAEQDHWRSDQRRWTKVTQHLNLAFLKDEANQSYKSNVIALINWLENNHDVPSPNFRLAGDEAAELA